MFVVSSHISFSIDSLALTFDDLVLFNPGDLIVGQGDSWHVKTAGISLVVPRIKKRALYFLCNVRSV